MHQNYNRYSYVLNNPLKYTDPSGWKYALEKTNKVDDPPINFENFHSNIGSGGGGGSSDFFSFGNSSSSSPHYNWSTGQYMQGGNQISFQSVQYWLNQTYTKTYTGNYGFMYSDRISSNGIGYGIIPVYEYRGANNTQFGGSNGWKDVPNSINNFIGNASTIMDIGVKLYGYEYLKKGILEKYIYEASKFSKKNLNIKFKPGDVNRFVKAQVGNAKTISPKLGGVSLILTGLDYNLNGDNWTTGQNANAIISSVLTVGAIINPTIAPIAFGYGVTQLGSWVISSRSVEENIELLITKP